MLEKVLIANRGEIALRVVRACRDLGVASVAVYSDADRGCRFVTEADEAVHIGPAPARQSYLAIDKLIAAAKEAGADSLHPGYGFLSENAALAQAVEEAGLSFIGPPAKVIAALGSKLETRRIMEAAGVPVMPGTGALSESDDVEALAAQVGFPLLVKPSGGGGGRGMRLVEDPGELSEAVESARRESASSFTDSAVYLERLMRDGRHVEVQILADSHGHVVHVGNRDCSMQRRHQKVVEEAPAPGLTPQQHTRVCALAVAAARAAGYVNAGTVEFLYDGEEFFILEVNTRIQVEHCVSEAISSIDLVAEQLRIAGGAELSLRQEDIVLRGHAIECRLYSEDPAKNFAPDAGTITAARFPAGPWVREDRGFEVGDEITPYYDGMLAKLVVWGPDRSTAIARTMRALHEYSIEGVSTNVEVLRWIVGGEAFRELRLDTGYIERELRAEDLSPGAQRSVAQSRPDTTRARVTPVIQPAAIGGSMRAQPVGLFHYHRRSHGVDQEYLIHVVKRGANFEAIPLSPADQRWPRKSCRRQSHSIEAALDALIDQVLDIQMPDEIFRDLGVTF